MNTLAPIKLSDAKLHLKIDDDDDFEDAYIQQLILAAEDFCEGRIFRTFDDVYTQYGFLPPVLRSYALVVMAEMHANRQLNSERPVNPNPFYERLIDKYVDYSKGV